MPTTPMPRSSRGSRATPTTPTGSRCTARRRSRRTSSSTTSTAARCLRPPRPTTATTPTAGSRRRGRAAPAQEQYQGQQYGYDAYGSGQSAQQGYAPQYDPYAQPHQQQQQQDWIPQQAQQSPYEQTSYDERSGYEQAAPQQYAAAEAPGAAPRVLGRRSGRSPPSPGSPSSAEAEYRTEQFSFIEEPDEDSEDVIDWLKFTESRTERREEAKRRGRSRIVALSVVLALLVAGGVGYLWWAGKLPGLAGADTGQAAASSGQKRDVLVVHLRDTATGNSSTALMVDNATTGKGTTVLLPNNLAVSKEDGTATTLGKSVKDEGVDPTRDSLNTLLGADIKASWRLDTPYLENLVETVGGITLDTDAAVPGEKKGDSPVVKRGQRAGPQRPGRRRLRHVPGARRGPGEAAPALRAGHAGDLEEGLQRRGRRHRHRQDAPPGARSAPHRGAAGQFAGAARGAGQDRGLPHHDAAGAGRRHAQPDGVAGRGQGRARRHGEEDRPRRHRPGRGPQRQRHRGRHGQGAGRAGQRRLHLRQRRQ